ncbi:MlaD family protein [Acidobacterium sp. S8]|uniref:MlaD family protein n=1 Tax=Acidobacterium sp. S8 TaxID=1641854 RepID=UPI00131DDC4D|nr:MlaD family protein [Acidobacterium sp. S8]
MPSQQEVQWSQLKVGVLVLVALVSLTALIFLMSGNTGGFLAGKITVRSYFENAAGLKVGAPVNLEGVTVGTVKSIRIVPERKLTPVEVIMRLSKKFQPAIHADSKTSLETIGVLGDTVLDINSKFATGAAIQNNAELQTTETPNLTDVIKSSQGTIEQLNTILAKVDNLVDALNTGKGSIGMLINDPSLYNRAVATLNEIQQLVDEVGNGKGSIGKLIADDTLYNRANATVGKLQDVANQIDSGNGTIGKLLKDETLYNNLRESTASLNALLKDVNAGKGGLGLIAKDPQFANKLNDTVTRLDSILNRVDNGEGTIGQLMVNKDLYNHTDEMIQNTNNLITAVRQNPKKYLTIHMKIF